MCHPRTSREKVGCLELGLQGGCDCDAGHVVSRSGVAAHLVPAARAARRMPCMTVQDGVAQRAPSFGSHNRQTETRRQLDIEDLVVDVGRKAAEGTVVRNPDAPGNVSDKICILSVSLTIFKRGENCTMSKE